MLKHSSLNKTIIFKLGALGDLLMTTPCIRAYKNSFPEEKLYFVIGKTTAKVLKTHPLIDRLIIINDENLFKKNLFFKLLESFRMFFLLKTIKAERIFLLHRDWRYQFLAFLIGFKERYGFARDLKGSFLTHAATVDPLDHEIDSLLKVFEKKDGFKKDGYKIDVFPTQQDYLEALPMIKKINFSKGTIAISPGGAMNIRHTMATKRWPIRYYKGLMELILKKTKYNIIIMGGKLDESIANDLNSEYSKRVHLGLCNIEQTVLLLNHCLLYITHDSGPLHIGSASTVPILSIFGPTHPSNYSPKEFFFHKYLWKGQNLSCSPCFDNGRFPQCSHHTCMKSITPQEVFNEIMAMLKKGIVKGCR